MGMVIRIKIIESIIIIPLTAWKSQYSYFAYIVSNLLLSVKDMRD